MVASLSPHQHELMFNPNDRITLVKSISATIIYADDVDLHQKTKNLKEFYNFSRQFGAIISKP
jgi:hypothetical protein